MGIFSRLALVKLQHTEILFAFMVVVVVVVVVRGFSFSLPEKYFCYGVSIYMDLILTVIILIGAV